MVAASLFLLTSLVASVLGHGDHDEPSDISLFRRNNLDERHEIQKRCGGTLAAIHRRRLARRGVQGPEARSEHMPRAALCSMTGETTEGPYYVNNELFRNNVTDGLGGVPLQLHITLLDVATCEVAPNYFVEIWGANSTGFYSGFTTASQGGGGDGGGPPGNGTGGPPGGSMSGSMTLPSGTGGGAPQATDSSTASTTIGPFDGADDPAGGGMGGGSTATDNLTFMRGATQADSNGETTIYANIPGWYQGRAVHIHVRVWENSTVASNGTFISSSGTLHHTGQLYFKQELVDEVAKLTPYSTNLLAYANATRNDEDSIYPYSTAGGYDPDLETSLLGATLEDGVLGEIVITINSTYISPSFSTAYHVADDGSDGTTTTTGAESDASNSCRSRRSPMRFRRWF